MVTDDKFDMFYSRLAKRVRLLGLASFADYCDYLQEPSHDAEIVELVNALTTNLTAFFRETIISSFLRKTAIPECMQRNWTSAGCASGRPGALTGEEPYSIAMVLAEQQALLSGWDSQILASDIDSNVLAQAKSGIYPLPRVENLPKARLKAFFQKGTGAHLARPGYVMCFAVISAIRKSI